MLQQPFSWTDANVQILRQMADDGAMTREIADRLGCNRNAVLGKARKLGVKFTHNKKNNNTLAWTPERMDIAEKMWAEGKNGTQIMRVLGGSRSSLAGMMFRNRDRFPQRAVKPPKPKAEKPKVEVPTIEAKTFPFDSAPFLLPEFPGVRFVDLQAHDCRFPVSNDTGPDMLCCGAKATEGSYCGVHASIARGRGTTSERKAHNGREWR